MSINAIRKIQQYHSIKKKTKKLLAMIRKAMFYKLYIKSDRSARTRQDVLYLLRVVNERFIFGKKCHCCC